MNLVFCGTPKFAADVLDRLCKSHKILSVVTKKDKPLGRKQDISPSDVKKMALANALDIFHPNNSTHLTQHLFSIKEKIDVVIVVAYGYMLEKELTDRFMCINLHGSLLPFFRGASPIQSSIINNFKHFGITLIKMNEIMDGGDILALMPIDKSEFLSMDINHILEKMAIIGGKLIDETLKKLDSITPKPQDHTLATYCRKINRSDGELNLEDANECFLRFVAYKYWPNVFIMVNGKKLKIMDMEINEYRSINTRGEIIDMNENGFILSCSKGSLNVKEVILESRGKMKISSFIQSMKLEIGSILY